MKPDWGYLEWKDIILIDRHPLFEIESHTVTHPWEPQNNLVTWSEGKNLDKGEKDILFELQESKRVLEARLNKEIKYLAWPNGFYNEKLIDLAKSIGYQALLTADQDLNVQGEDVYKIRRIMIHGACDIDAFKNILSKGNSNESFKTK